MKKVCTAIALAAVFCVSLDLYAEEPLPSQDDSSCESGFRAVPKSDPEYVEITKEVIKWARGIRHTPLVVDVSGSLSYGTHFLMDLTGPREVKVRTAATNDRYIPYRITEV